MKKIIKTMFCLFLCMSILTGCGEKEEEAVVEGTGIFYLNTEKTGLAKKKYTIASSEKEDCIEELLEEMQKETDSIEYVSAFPSDVKIEEWKVHGKALDLYFNVKYNDMSTASEILLRAAVVQTLTQVEDVELIAFYSAGQPVTDNKGVEIGYLSKDDFVQNIGTNLHSYQKRELKLYFVCSEEGELKAENISVRYNSNMSIEKVIVEELLDGPSKEGLQSTFPADVKVLGVSVKDGICYVNFDEDFLKTQPAVDPNMMIYSLVNSIIEGGNVSKVQLLVNGEANVKYQETIDFSQPFSRNLDIVVEEK